MPERHQPSRRGRGRGSHLGTKQFIQTLNPLMKWEDLKEANRGRPNNRYCHMAQGHLTGSCWQGNHTLLPTIQNTET